VSMSLTSPLSNIQVYLCRTKLECLSLSPPQLSNIQVHLYRAKLECLSLSITSILV
jgi:hypothetical protein